MPPTGSDWRDFLHRARPKLNWDEAGNVLCLDPGETTGWALFRQGLLDACGQEATPDPEDMAEFLAEACSTTLIDTIVYEEYRVRGNKYQEHVGSEVVTIQHIGAIRVVANELGITLWKQSAGMAKNFATDSKLRRWGLYQSGRRHSNDAIRHGVYYLLFGAARHWPHKVGEAP